MGGDVVTYVLFYYKLLVRFNPEKNPDYVAQVAITCCCSYGVSRDQNIYEQGMLNTLKHGVQITIHFNDPVTKQEEYHFEKS